MDHVCASSHTASPVCPATFQRSSVVDQYENCDSKELYGEALAPGYVNIRIFTVKIHHCIVKSDHEYTEGISKVPICKCYCFDVAASASATF